MGDRTGKERTAELIEKINGPDSPIPANIEGADVPLDLLHTANLLPCGYHRYYVMTQEMLEHQLVDYTNHTTRAETVRRIEDELFALYADPDLDHKLSSWRCAAARTTPTPPAARSPRSTTTPRYG